MGDPPVGVPPCAGTSPAFQVRDRDTLTHTRRWELWEDEGETAFFPSSSEKNRVMARVSGLVKTWETEASSLNEAMQKLYDHLDFGQYQPQLRQDGTPYPEDEDDDFRGEDDSLFAAWPGWCSVAGVAVNVPGEPNPDSVVRTGLLEFVCPACGQTHVWRFEG